MSVMKCSLMLQNARPTAFTVSELLRGGGGLGRGGGHTQIRDKAEALLKLSFSEAQDWRCSAKKTPTQVFSSEFLGSLKNTCLEECLRTIASGLLLKSINIEISTQLSCCFIRLSELSRSI